MSFNSTSVYQKHLNDYLVFVEVIKIVLKYINISYPILDPFFHTWIIVTVQHLIIFWVPWSWMCWYLCIYKLIFFLFLEISATRASCFSWIHESLMEMHLDSPNLSQHSISISINSIKRIFFFHIDEMFWSMFCSNLLLFIFFDRKRCFLCF